MDIRKCEAFLVSAESGSFTKAAHILGYSQVAITRLIAGLEDELGFPLFSRSKKGVILTENGKLMLPAFRELVCSGRNAEQLAAEIKGIVSGVLTIGSYYSVSTMLLPGIIKNFQQKFPEVKVNMLEGGNREMCRWLSEKSVDCCFLADPGDSACDWTPVFQDEIVAWLPRKHPLASSASFPIRNLNSEPFIHTQPGEDTELDRMLASHRLTPNVCFTTRDAFTTYNMVAAGLGISCNQRLISAKWDKSIAEVPFDPPQYLSLGIAVPSRTEMSPAARKFIDCAMETIRSLQKE